MFKKFLGRSLEPTKTAEETAKAVDVEEEVFKTLQALGAALIANGTTPAKYIEETKAMLQQRILGMTASLKAKEQEKLALLTKMETEMDAVQAKYMPTITATTQAMNEIQEQLDAAESLAKIIGYFAQAN